VAYIFIRAYIDASETKHHNTPELMQATLDAFALKSLHRALTCLTKYGEDLTIDANPDSLSLFTTNSSKSAYCRFRYQKDFFSKYVVRHGRDGDPGDEEPCAQGQLLTKVSVVNRCKVGSGHLCTRPRCP
jgi:hypothetical protein